MEDKNGCAMVRTPIMGIGKASRLADSNEYVVTELTTIECSDGKIRRVPQRLIGKILKQDEIFQTAITPIEESDFIGYVKHSFGGALEMLEQGNAMAREGWNGKGMFIYYVPKNTYPAQTNVAKNLIGDTVPYSDYLAMKTSQGDVVPWLASQTDILAKDWIVIKNL